MTLYFYGLENYLELLRWARCLCSHLFLPIDYSKASLGALLSLPCTRGATLFSSGKAKPKVFIISIFPLEGEVWWGIPEFDLLATNITVPGFSPLFPDAHCTADGDLCQLVTGESGGCLFHTVLVITFGIS